MQEILDKLKLEGWKSIKYPTDNKVLYYKSFPNHQRCKANDDKDKQIEIYYYYFMRERFQIECVGELKDGSWVNFSFYHIDNPTYEILMEKVSDLLVMWDKISFANDQK